MQLRNVAVSKVATLPQTSTQHQTDAFLICLRLTFRFVFFSSVDGRLWGQKQRKEKFEESPQCSDHRGLCAPGTLCSPELNPDSPAPMLPHQTKNHLKKKKKDKQPFDLRLRSQLAFNFFFL